MKTARLALANCRLLGGRNGRTPLPLALWKTGRRCESSAQRACAFDTSGKTLAEWQHRKFTRAEQSAAGFFMSERRCHDRRSTPLPAAGETKRGGCPEHRAVTSRSLLIPNPQFRSLWRQLSSVTDGRSPSANAEIEQCHSMTKHRSSGRSGNSTRSWTGNCSKRFRPAIP
jgi:hypothetical protein